MSAISVTRYAFFHHPSNTFLHRKGLVKYQCSPSWSDAYYGVLTDDVSVAFKIEELKAAQYYLSEIKTKCGFLCSESPNKLVVNPKHIELKEVTVSYTVG